MTKKTAEGQILEFPKGFLWGSATAAHQVEGLNIHSDWWEWENRKQERKKSGLACDQYHLFEKDFDLAAQLYQNAHRLSIEWARLEPGMGKWQEKEFDHYRKVLTSLRRRKIKTFVTLFHFTLPAWLAKKGGYEDKANLLYFRRYVEKVSFELGDLIDYWITINEPNIYIGCSYLKGYWPPEKKNRLLAVKVYLNLADAHRQAYQLIHQTFPQASVGMAMNMTAFHSESILGALLVKTAQLFYNHSFYWLTKGKHDFLGVNFYFYHNLALLDLNILRKLGLSKIKQVIMEKPSDGIYEVTLDLKKYDLPIYITENGVADAKDRLRTKYILNNLSWLHQAIKEGVDIRGYLHWSLIDNFEWEFGFERKFGLIEVDFRTQKRTIRPSALVYAKICQKNAIAI